MIYSIAKCFTDNIIFIKFRRQENKTLDHIRCVDTEGDNEDMSEIVNDRIGITG